LNFFFDKLIRAEGARLLRANYLNILLARHATRNILRQSLLVDAGAQNFHVGETLKGAKRQGAHRTPRGKGALGAEINSFQQQ
jgi:hypothetical protein